ncbi:MAG TPA: PAS domain S-box protein, partial [Syntrophomonadaceae bacterium]|nr:PAS domain S-box protein [Syntrophomonadaceae bacterium]HPR94631.1 PAS domain S-box protein [Syntrophomonadaceae bacterium]
LETEVIRQRQRIEELTAELDKWHIMAGKLSDVFYNNQLPMAVSNFDDGLIIIVNNTFSDVMGYSREEARTKSIYDIQLWEDPAERYELIKKVAENGSFSRPTCSFIKKDGEMLHGHLAYSLIELDGKRYLITLIMDSTEKIKMRKSLQIANEMFSKAFYNNLIIMGISRLEDGVYIDVNNVFADKYGLAREEIIGKSAFELGIWTDSEDRLKMSEQLHTDGYMENQEYRFRNRDGEVGHVITNLNVLEIYGEKCIVISAMDITQRKIVEESLKQSRKLLLQIFNSNPLSIIVVSTKDQRIIEVNDTFLVQYNLVRENFTGGEKIYLYDWFGRDEIYDSFNAVIAQGFIQNREISYQLINGESRISLVSAVLISWEGDECVLVISNDITELRNYQKEMARLDNLKLIGQMSAGMAHEIRNPMTSIRGYLELFKMRDRYKNDIEVLDLVIGEIDRLNDLITVFMSLAKNREIDLKPQSLKTTIMNLMPLILVDAYQQNVSVEVDLQDTEQVMIDEAQIRQLIFNLAHNGLDAMPLGGILTFRTYQDYNGVNLVIQDQGNGISSEVLDQIGTPFFTTKDNGTGLGLAVCYSIVENHNAKINFKTGENGTAFTVTFLRVSNK